jgi:lipopolysaccharide export system protein LptA
MTTMKRWLAELQHIAWGGVLLAFVALGASQAAAQVQAPMPAQAQAPKPDGQAPIQIWANASSYDGVKKLNSYKGNVQLLRGGLQLDAERLDIKEQKNGDQIATAKGRKNQVAKFKQKRDELDEYVEGEAESIEYNSQTEVLVLSKKAVIRRLIGSVVQDEVSADHIKYEALGNVFNATGALPQGADGQPGRVAAVLKPAGTDSKK